MDYAHLIPALEQIARDAGRLIMQIYATDFSVYGKDDNSPVTDADHQAEALIEQALRVLTPDIPIVAEEAAAAGREDEAEGCFWLVDPLDGTREFVSRTGEFTVNIGLIVRHVPVLGVIYAPALDRLFSGVVGQGAWLTEASGRRQITTRKAPAEGLTVVASRVHGDTAVMQDYLADKRVASVCNAGSSLKMCLIAAGEADLYPRFGRTMEWDTAAGHAILRAAGGRLTDTAGEELGYGKRGYENPDFIALG
ncbi:3'(2'),5'-bisphosphate nucleotidase CysQ [Pseudohongiella spirulinae]|uniref:3'(2'),5'-bisphosphate nucleotidase CysQ n=1 Tax=Pseudohongiella spirulinae TaxID=1249552 RepID=A0A0S2KDP1_9GAMM|nr:3'(2'),5'-bisphosphate nucleotidase CysQ [Pseudohongiella spirulinae]ALO46361.1 3'-5'-bisphosphate nucleotidase [Pseudohongiella spirulinae]